MTNTEQKMSEAAFAPAQVEEGVATWPARSPGTSYLTGSTVDGDRGWADDMGGTEEQDETGVSEQRGASGHAAGDSDGSRAPGENEETPRSEVDRVLPHEVNQSLARLEMNSLQVKLYLDSIDQRISRMEPRLDGRHAAESVPAQELPHVPAPAETVPAEEIVQERVAAVDTEPPLTTSERRRRAQGVPVERRRARHAVSVETEDEEPWSWKPWMEVMPWIRRHQTLVPAVAAGLVAVGLLSWWGTGKNVGPKVQTRAEGVPAVQASAATSGAQKSSPDIPWGRGARVVRNGVGRQEVSNRAGEAKAVRPGVEQGVAVPPSSLSSAAAIAGGVSSVSPSYTPANVTTLPGDASGSGGLRADAGTARTSDAALGEVHAASGSGSLGSDSAASGSAPGASRAGSTPSGRIIPPSYKRVNVSSGVMAGNLIYSRQPTYPRGLASLFRTQGSVVMQAVISKSGRVQNVRVISGHYMLRGAAKDAVRTWRYRPYYVNGSPVEVATIVSVDFRR